ncbi:Spy0128 family protein [Clostridium facile]|uniref:VWA domain-containing protein n=1 Tax=Clostridium facile TaxID=2763035 RepID=A0ABR7IQ57_9CLOT|nr:FctA domain-containing protein [Clostridium facile]MBC5787252.1 VWA domain-containing protein [Clostridium facile]
MMQDIEKSRFRLKHRLLASFLTLMMLFSCVFTNIPVMAADDPIGTKTVDPITMRDWSNDYISNDTTRVGRIWTDKSVSAEDVTLNPSGTEEIPVRRSDSDNFLVGLSAISSNKSIVGQSTIPVDVMLVLDVSNSMSSTSIERMVNATNDSIKNLLELNVNNRVGVALYASGNGVLLEPDHYSTTDNTSNFLEYSSWRDEIEVTNVVRDSNNNRVSNSQSVGGGTYIQSGVYASLQEFLKLPEDSLSVEGTKRIPVIVLMSDGNPTYGTTNYTAVGNSNMGNGTSNSSTNEVGFVTQLTNAYTRSQLEQRYSRDALFYTLGFNVGSSNIAKAVLDPSRNNTQGMQQYWRTYQSTPVGQSMNLGRSRITVVDGIDSIEYVDQYFTANNEDQLQTAFESIVEEIIIQSRYYPTDTDSSGSELSGYITFEDEIGDYMQIKNLNGLFYGERLYTGAIFTRSIKESIDYWGDLDYQDDAYVYQYVQSVMERLSIDEATAVALIENAYQYGQISYTNDNEFSNYVAWYGAADKSYIAPYKPGQPAPDSAVYLNHSYVYSGEPGISGGGVYGTDLMYVGPRVQTEIATGKQTMMLSIPAALIPVLRYTVTLDTDDLETATTAQTDVTVVFPMRFFYEVGVKDGITKDNVSSVVSEDYPYQNGNGEYSFYTNAWNDLTDQDDTAGTHVNFDPSQENEFYYYPKDTMIYEKIGENYRPVTSEPVQGETYYYQTQVFSTENNTIQRNWNEITPQALAKKDYNAESGWHIPKGTSKYTNSSYVTPKADNTTGTAVNSLEPSLVVGQDGHISVQVGLGNNGKIVVSANDGSLTISKAVAGDYADQQKDFTFTINLKDTNNLPLSGSFAYIGSKTGTISDGDTITLKHGESITIQKLPIGTNYTVTETTANGYIADQLVKTGVVSGKDENGAVAAFTNTYSFDQPGSLSGSTYLSGTKTLGRDWLDTDEFTFTLAAGNDSTQQAITDGKVVLPTATTMVNKDNQNYRFGDITFTAPGDYSFKITEEKGNIPGVGYDSHTVIVNVSVTDGKDGTLIVGQPTYTGSRNFVNTYTPDSVTVTGNAAISGTKSLTGATLTKNQFTFTVTPQGNAPAPAKSTATNDGQGNFNFGDITFATAGTYSYEIREVNAGAGGFTYDDTVYTVTFQVEDNPATGKLEVTSKTISSNPAGKTAIAFNNGYDATDTTYTIRGKKSVTVTDGNFTLQNGQFNFTLTSVNGAPMPDGVAGSQTVSNVGEDFTFGTINFTAPGTYQYQVKENSENPITGISYDGSTYDVSIQVDDQNGTLNVTNVSITKDSVPAELRFTNTYTPEDITLGEDGNAALGGTKTVTPTPGNTFELKDNQFNFTLSPVNGAPMPDGVVGSQTVSNTGSSFAFGNITYTHTGEYRYTITEVSGNITGIGYDTTTYTAIVTVSDNNGKLTASVAYEGGTSTTTAAFNNTYQPTTVVIGNNTNAGIAGNKTVTGDYTLKGNDFTFTLTAVTQNAPMPNPTSVTNNTQGGFAFGEMTYTAPGVYQYEVKEDNAVAPINGMSYDNTVYLVTVTVKDNGGTLSADVSYAIKDGDAVDAMVFNNTYQPQSVTLGGDAALGGTKTVTGDYTLKADEFSFTLTPVDGAPMPQGVTGSQTVKNDASGNFKFGDITFTKAGTYQYTITEVSGNIPGMSYDGANYTITVTVGDQNGQLVIERTVIASDKTQGPIHVVQFTNTYEPTAVTVSNLGGTKQLTGRAQKAGEFTFELTSKDNAPMPEKATAQNNVDGKFTFGSIQFTHQGEYHYTITEKAGTDSHIGYDTSSFDVTIKVTDVDGKLQAEVVYPDGGVVFNNTYTPDEVIVGPDGTVTAIGGTKTVTALEAGNSYTIKGREFEFTLTPVTKDAPMPKETTVTNDQAGNFAFGNITFDKEGEYEYQIAETKGDNTLFTYDQTVYTVTVQVTDNNGQLEAVVSYAGGTSTDKAVFDNKYDPEDVTLGEDGNATLGGTKTVTASEGNSYTLKEGEFSFILKPVDGAPMPEGTQGSQTVANDKDGDFTFGKITYTHAGEYQYTISEEPGSIYHMTYDATVYNVTVKVTDNNGKLEAAVSYAGGTSTDKAAFDNKYDPEEIVVGPDGTVAAIGGTKTVTSSEGNSYTMQGGEFEFTLTPVTKDAPMPASNTAVNGVDGSFAFGNIAFDKVGDYEYQIAETKGSQKGIAYDETVYTVTIKVTDTDQDGKLEAAVSYTGGTSTDKAAFDNGYDPEDVTLGKDGNAALGGSKELAGRDLKAGEFEFTLTANGKAPMPEGVTGTQTVKNDGAGNFTFGNITYTKPGNYEYTISEKPGSVGGVTYDDEVYTVIVKVTDNGGQLVANVQYIDGENNQAVFHNTYAAAKTSVTLGAMKNLEGRELKAGEFSFELKQNDIVVDTKTNAGTGAIQFAPIEFTTAGVYTYTIVETTSSLGGIAYDPAVYTVTVTVTDDLQGHLNAVASYQKDGVDVTSIQFNNSYKAAPTDVVLNATKVLEGRGLNAGEFTFLLKDNSGDVISQVTNQANGNVAFDSIHYDQAGTYYYTIEELPGSLGGVRYDKTVYDVTVTVTDTKDGKLQPSVAYTNQGVAVVGNPVFTNQYKADPVTIGEATSNALQGSKVLTGRDLQNGEFTFELVAVTQNAPMPASNTAVNRQDGSFVFGDITYHEAGSYVYTIKEVAGDKGGISYDAASFTATVTVIDDGSGQLKAEVAYSEQPVFHNTYTAAASDGITIDATKVLNGRDMAAGEFEFVLTGQDGNTMTANNTAAANGQPGKVTFGPITYDKAGTYIYTLTEKANGLGGVTYDSASYTVTVTVTDDNLGKLHAAVAYSKDGQEVATPQFTNTYSAGTTNMTFHANKLLNGRDLKDQEFSFSLEGEDGTLIQQVKNNQAGAVEFSPITYDKAGTYIYTVTEDNGSLGGVAYDTAVYTVTVTVTDDLQGHLSAAASYQKDGQNATGIQFTNTYTAKPVTIGGTTSTPLDGSKTLDGRNLNAGEFEFALAPVTDNAPMPSEAVVKNVAGGMFSFGEITYTETGTYTYTVVENNNDLGGVTYDNTVYTVTVTVTDDGNGNLIAAVAYSKDNQLVEHMVFHNQYTAAGTQVTIHANKALDGRDMKAGEFTFLLTDQSGKVVGKAVNTATGTVLFDPISYNTAGTYTYTLTEQDNGLGGITYDTSVYTVTVTVTDDGNGQLHAAVSYAKDGKAVDQVQFNNLYTIDSVTASISADKVLSGRDMQTGEFSFLLKDEDGNIIGKATNAADGSIQFNGIEYTQPGTYFYTLSEQFGNAEGMSYDATVYTVVVIVTDDGEGHLVATIKYLGGSKPVFYNTYTEPVAPPEPVPPVVNPDEPPKTGDDGLSIWLMLLALSTLGLAAFMKKSRKKRGSHNG